MLNNSKKYPVYLSILLLFLVCLSVDINVDPKLVIPENNGKFSFPFGAAIAGPIYLVGNDALGSHENITGTGEPGDPYVIRDLIITNTTGSCIEIINTSKYIEIINCSLVGFGNTLKGAIHLKNASNVKIYNNTATNSIHGIRIEDSTNIALYQNNITFSSSNAIFCWNVYNALIFNNTIYNNSYGVHFHTAGYNYNISIYNNKFANNSRVAVDLYNMFLVSISNNTFTNESYSITTNYYVISLSNSTNTTISRNSLVSRGGITISTTSHNCTIDSNIISILQPNPTGFNGIDCSSSNNLTIINNSIFTPAQYGIYLTSISTCNMINNTIDHAYYSGIYCTASSFLNIINNTAIKSDAYNGIDVRTSSQVFIFKNIANDNYRTGISVYSCPNSIIVNNTALKNSQYSSFYFAGISLETSANSIIENNTCNYNKKHGIRLDSLSNCNITNNIIMHNEYNGVYLRNANWNNITRNYILNSTDNSLCYIDDPFGNGIYMDSSDYNKIFNNQIINNSNNGVYLEYIDSCEIFENTIKGSDNAGLFLESSSYIYIYKNEISFCSDYGICDSEGYQNRIYQNEISDNDDIGVYLEDCDDFLVYLNLFYRNENYNALEEDCPEDVLWIYWNYYDDYHVRYPTAVVNGSFWSIPYAWSANTLYDYYPLVNPSLNPPNVPDAPLLSNLDGLSKFPTYELNWDLVVGAQSYLIYVDYEYLTTVPSSTTSFSITLSLGEHNIYITAYNTTGQSLWSNIVFIVQISPSAGEFTFNTDWIIEWDLTSDIRLKDLPKIWGLPDFFFVVWTNDTYSGGDGQIVLSKWNYNGVCFWNSSYSNVSIEFSMGADIWSDGLYIYTAGTAKDSEDNWGILMIKWDLDGNIIKEKFFFSEYTREVIVMTGFSDYIYTTGNYIEDSSEETIFYVEIIKWNKTSLEVVNSHLWRSNEEYYQFPNAIYIDNSILYVVGYVRPYSSFGFLLTYSLNLALNNVAIDFLDASDYPDYRIQSITSDSSNLYLIGITSEELIFIKIAKSDGFRTISFIEMTQPVIYSSGMYQGYIWAAGGVRIIHPTEGLIQAAYIFQITPTGVLVNVSYVVDDFFCDFIIHDDSFILTHLYTYLLFGEIQIYNSKIYIFDPPFVIPFGTALGTPVILTQGQTITEFSIVITWTGVSGATNYRIYVNNLLYNVVTSTSCIIYFAEYKDYEIYITASNAIIESLASNKIVIKVREPSPSGEILAGMAAIGGVTGAVASNIAGSQGAGNITKRGFGRKRKLNLQPDTTSQGATISGDEPIPMESLQSQVGVAVPGDYVGLFDKFRLLWEHMPSNIKKSVFRSLNRFFKFKDEASIDMFTAFQNLSNDFFKACTLIREGKLNEAVSMLDKISKESHNKEFSDLALESEQLSDIAKNEPQSMPKRTTSLNTKEELLNE